MGYSSFPCDIKSNREFYEYHLKSQWAKTCQVLDVSFNGSQIWELIQHGEEIFVAVTLVSRKGGEIYYKTISDDAGPCYYDCPVKFLDRCVNTSQRAKDWYQACREYKAQKLAHRKTIQTLKVKAKKGDILELTSGRKVRFEFHHNKNRFAGRLISDNTDNNQLFAWRYKDIKNNLDSVSI